MQCPDESVLQMLVEGALANEATESVGLHLGRCPACREKVVEYKQLMWDLHQESEHIELPAELESMQTALLDAWREQGRREDEGRRAQRSLLPSWAGHTVAWARHVPPLEYVGGVLSRVSLRSLGALLPRRTRGRRKGGGRR